jgi:hypothetical protein
MGRGAGARLGCDRLSIGPDGSQARTRVKAPFSQPGDQDRDPLLELGHSLVEVLYAWKELAGDSGEGHPEPARFSAALALGGWREVGEGALAPAAAD